MVLCGVCYGPLWSFAVFSQTALLPPKRGIAAHHFSAHVYCGQTAGLIKMPLGTEVDLGPGDIVLDGDPPIPLRKGHRSPHLSALVYCGQTAEWIMIPLGMEVSRGPSDVVLYGYPCPHGKGHSRLSPPLFCTVALARSPILAPAEHLLCHMYM